MYELTIRLNSVLNSSYECLYDYNSTVAYLSTKMTLSKADAEYGYKIKNDYINAINLPNIALPTSIIKDKTAFLITGAIGSGKSTIAYLLYSKGFFAEDVEFLCEDLIKKNYFDDVCPLKKAYAYAKTYLRYKLNRLQQDNQDFVYELVPSNKEKLNVLKQIKENGYKLISIYLCTDNEQINLNRVQNRMLSGADFVSSEKVISRFNLSLEQLDGIVSLSEIVYLVNSLSKGFKLIGYSENKRIVMLNK